jgi:Ala-tRNA(Pro) deacylase
MRLDEFLTNQRVTFRRLHHEPVYTANRIAQTLHIPGREMAKSVLTRTPHGYILAVVPATHRVDLERLRQELGENEIELASEEELEQLFPDCEPGAMPPFGSLYHVLTMVDQSLAEDEQIVFEGQDHEEAICMTYSDYTALEHPRVGQFATRG